MKDIYYNVSGVNMDLLQFLLSFFASEYGKNLSPLIEIFKKNNFDLKKVLASINLDTLAPIIKNFMENAQKNRPEHTERNVYGLSPISKFADKDVVYALNSYFGQLN